MKRLSSLFCTLFVIATMACAQTVKTYRIEINKEDFKFFEDEHGFVITYRFTDFIQHFKSEYDKPAIPYLSSRILLPEQEKLKSISFEFSANGDKDENILLIPNPGYTPTDNETDGNGLPTAYPAKTYPLEACLLEEAEYSGLRYASFEFTPFAYDAVKKDINWASAIDIRIETEPMDEWVYRPHIDSYEKLSFGNVINSEDLWTERRMPSIVGSVWSYINYQGTSDEGDEYFRYTVLDEPKEINGMNYYPMVRYTTDRYTPTPNSQKVYLREEKYKIYRYMEQEGKDSLLYDFSLIPYIYGKEVQYNFFRKEGSDSLWARQHSIVHSAEDKLPFRKMSVGTIHKTTEKNSIMEWIDGIGDIHDFLYTLNDEGDATSILNYYHSGDGKVVYKNALEGKEGIPEFQENDGAIIDEKQSRHPIALEGKTWNLSRVMPHIVPYVYDVKQWIEGDTLVDGMPCKKLYTLTTTEDERISQKRKLEVGYCRQEGEKFYKDGVLMYDFGMKEGEIFSFEEEETYAIVTHVGDTTLTDGITRKCLTMNNYFPEWDIISMASDKWIEGIGSLKMGVYSNFFMFGGYNNTLLSCTHNNTVIYEKESSDIDRMRYILKRPAVTIRPIGQTLTCTAPDAVKLEVYTMDAVKVGETLFANGTATVKVSKAPAMYLYIVTYRDGRRESGKVMSK